MDLSARKKTVAREFDALARGYDLMTRLNPGYRKHLRWSAERMQLPAGAQVLDLCCGTGLSTEALVRAYPDAQVTGLDGSPGMLAIARRKPVGAKARFVLGDAMRPGDAGIIGPFDGILMAYGIRNMPDVDGCLAEVFRLLAPGGTACFHEYSVADSFARRWAWTAICHGVIVPLGAVTSGEIGIYRYLHRSVLAFDGVSAFEARLQRAGFVEVRTLPMDGWQRGIVHSFLGRRPR
jgi:ubiquinone/menaquinone biosynthesis C-methylase UbiE